jgi:hypothetical protein
MAELEQDDLAAVIWAKIQAGALPVERPVKLWVGPANGRTFCDGCGQVIVANNLEYEIDMSDRRIFRFDRECLGLWQQERVRAE